MIICTLVQWWISRREDSGTALPGFAQKHIGHCANCRTFAAFTGQLGALLATSELPARSVEERFAREAGFVPVRVWLTAAAVGMLLFAAGFAMVHRGRFPTGNPAGMRPAEFVLQEETGSMDQGNELAEFAGLLDTAAIHSEVDALEADLAQAMTHLDRCLDHLM